MKFLILLGFYICQCRKNEVFATEKKIRSVDFEEKTIM